MLHVILTSYLRSCFELLFSVGGWCEGARAALVQKRIFLRVRGTMKEANDWWEIHSSTRASAVVSFHVCFLLMRFNYYSELICQSNK